MFDRRRLALGVGVFAVVVLVGAWPLGSVRRGFSQIFSPVASAVLETWEIEGDLRVRLEAMPESAERKASDNVEADTQIVLSVPTAGREWRLGASLRRDVYLPFVIFSALIVALPLAPRRKLGSLLVGSAVVLMVGIASFWVIVSHLLAQAPASRLPEWQRELVGFVFERVLTPPGNRVIAPLLFGLTIAFAFGWRPSFGSSSRVAPAFR